MEKYLVEGNISVKACLLANRRDVFEIYTEPDDLYAVNDALVAAGYEIESCEKDKIASNYVTLDNADDIKYMNLLIENLEDHDDVMNVYHNWENAE